MHSFLRFIPILALLGCSTSRMVVFEVTSEPSNAQIEVDGYSMGTTPTQIQLACSEKWVGLAFSPDGFQRSGSYTVTAYPPAGAIGDPQSKEINPWRWEGTSNPSIFFDLQIRDVEPVDRLEIELNSTNKTTSPRGKCETMLKALRDLRDGGVITKEEFAERALKVLENCEE